MHQETITYENFNGVQVKEIAMFNISKAEIMQMELSEEGSYRTRLQKLIDTKDVKELIRLFTGLIDISYGIKSEDGKDVFFHYSALVMEGFKDIAVESAVEFDVEETEKGLRAANVKKID